MNYCSNHATADCNYDDSTTIIRLHHASSYVDLMSSPILKCHRSNIVTSPFP